MARIRWIKRFEPLNEETLLKTVLETERWLEKYSHREGDSRYWEVMPEKETDPEGLLLKDTSLYAGSAGISLFYLRLYLAAKEDIWLEKAREGIHHVIRNYRGIEDFRTDAQFLAGAYIGYLNSPAGGAYAAGWLYEITKEEQYRLFAMKVAEDVISAAKEENGTLTWYGFYGILGEGGLILFLLDAYQRYGKEEYLIAAEKAGRYIAERKEAAPSGGARWYVMPTDTFPTIGKAGGYFPGFEYGTAGTGYLFACLYEQTGKWEYLGLAEEAAEYVAGIADVSEDGEAALVKYNDPWLPDLYYLGVCQGPVGTSRLFFKLHELTGKQEYLKFVEQLTNGLISAGAPLVHSEGYWRTNCYCCGAAGMLEHFVNMHRLTGRAEYLKAACEAAEAILGESTVKDQLRNWYTAWNRHEPDKSEAYTGLYHGSAGCASALLYFRQYLLDQMDTVPYLEDPYYSLFTAKLGRRKSE